jgi:hypothetical protein
MAFSTTSDHLQTGTQIVTEALEIIGVLEAGGTISADDQTSSLRTLNNLLKLWSKTMPITARGEYRLQLSADDGTYTLDTTNVGYIPEKVIYANLIDATYYDSANLTVAYDSLAVSTYTVGETVTFSGGSTAIVITDDGVDGQTVRLAEGDATPANDETMLGGTSATTSTVNGTPAAKAQAGASGEIPMTELSTGEWYELTNKLETTGTPVNFWARNKVTGVGMDFQVWPVPEDTKYDIVMWLQYKLRDVDTITDDVWVAQEWYMALAYGLAAYLGPKWGLDRNDVKALMATAQTLRFEAENSQYADSVYMQPEER